MRQHQVRRLAYLFENAALEDAEAGMQIEANLARRPGCRGGPRNCQRRFDAQRPARQPQAVLCFDQPGRHDARVYTDDAEALRHAVSREPHKEIALDAIRQRPTLGTCI